MQGSTEKRVSHKAFILSTLPAAAMTIGMFIGMNRLIHVDEIVLKEPEFRTLADVTPADEVTPPPVISKRDIVPIEVAAPPPRRVATKLSEAPVTLEPAVWKVPELTTGAGKFEIPSAPTAFGRTQEAIPVQKPVPVYPVRAVDNGIEGVCDVHFSIDPAGRPYNINAECSHSVFQKSSETAVRKARFAARVEDGVVMGQDNLVFPIEYTLDD